MSEPTVFFELLRALWLAIPVTLAGLTHVWVMRRGLLSPLARVPLDGGLTFRSRRLFGENKTLRGAVVMSAAAALWISLFDNLERACCLSMGLRLVDAARWPSIPYGALLGAGYIVGELPNSFAKRQLDIAPGAPAAGARSLFWLIDQVDSTLAVLVILACLTPLSLAFCGWLIALTLVLHPTVAFVMVHLGLKRRIG
jgi:hypothetical protein